MVDFGLVGCGRGDSFHADVSPTAVVSIFRAALIVNANTNVNSVEVLNIPGGHLDLKWQSRVQIQSRTHG